MSREFCRDVPDPWGCSKSLCKKSSCAFFVPESERNCNRLDLCCRLPRHSDRPNPVHYLHDTVSLLVANIRSWNRQPVDPVVGDPVRQDNDKIRERGNRALVIVL